MGQKERLGWNLAYQPWGEGVKGLEVAGDGDGF